MQSALETFLTGGILAFLLTFARFGTAIMIMPGLGDSFVSERIRLHMALAISFVLSPLVFSFVPVPLPSMFVLIALIVQEIIIGLLIGTVARIFMTAMDTAGMVVSSQSGFANAQVFNPSLAAQGSVMGAFLSVTGVVILFSTNMHHLLLSGLVESYKFFPMGQLPDTGDMADMIAKAVSASFMIGIQISTPFIVVTMLIYVGMGVLSRLMPQVQVFLISLPVQIILSLITLYLVLSVLIHTWLESYESAMLYFFSLGGQ